MIFDQFEITKMTPNPSILIIGNEGDTKNHIIQKIIHTLRHTSDVLIISSDEDSKIFYKNLFPNAQIHENFNEPLLMIY